MPLSRKQKEKKLELLREKKRRNFFEFFKNTIPRYQDSRFYHNLCDELQKFGASLNACDFPHLMLNMAPRVGKSASILRFFAWMMLRNPDFKCIYATYSDRLSKIMSREMKLIMDSDYVRNLWPDVQIKDGHSALDHWSLSNESSIFFTSIGGSISGIGFNLAALDDIFASMEMANSEAYREQMFSWVSSAFMTRGLPEKHGIIFNFTRWVESDLAGFVEKEERDNPLFPRFKKIQYPIINKEDCEYGKKGESLIPERFSQQLLSQMKAKVGSKVWEALYLCNPRSDADKIINIDWIKQVDKLPIVNWNRQKVIVIVDLAFSGKTTSDFNACVCLGQGLDGKIYLLDYLRIKADFVDFMKRFTVWYSKLPTVNRLIIEEKANGAAMLSVLKNKFFNIKTVCPDKDKVSRTSAVAPMIESGSLVFLKQPTNEYQDILEEIDHFPEKGYHDDFLDALVHGLQEFLEEAQSNLEDVDWNKLCGIY